MKTQPGDSKQQHESTPLAEDETYLRGLDAIKAVLKNDPHEHLCDHWRGKRGSELPCTCKLGLIKKHMQEALSDRKEMRTELDTVKKNYTRYANRFVMEDETLRRLR